MTDFRATEIRDVIEIVPRRFGDHRGWFSEVFKRSDLADAGVRIDWMQDNQSFSAPAGTVRGLHFQVPPVAQDKLVRVLRGAIFDVAVDIRPGSPTFGQHVSARLDAKTDSYIAELPSLKLRDVRISAELVRARILVLLEYISRLQAP